MFESEASSAMVCDVRNLDMFSNIIIGQEYHLLACGKVACISQRRHIVQDRLISVNNYRQVTAEEVSHGVYRM